MPCLASSQLMPYRVPRAACDAEWSRLMPVWCDVMSRLMPVWCDVMSRLTGMAEDTKTAQYHHRSTQDNATRYNRVR